MKTMVVFWLAAGVLALSAQAQTADQFSKNAAKFASQSAYPIVAVTETTIKGQWVQQQARVANSKWNIRRIDAAQPPLVASVSFDLYSGSTEPKPSREDADIPLDLPLGTLQRVELEYLQTATGWAFSKGRRTLRSDTLAITPPANLAVFTPINWVIQGFSVQP